MTKRALTSHLSTHGRSLVVGDELNEVNEFIKFLSIFLNEKEKKKSTLMREESKFIPDLVLQGVNQTNYKKIQDDQFIQSLFPTSVIDLKSLSGKKNFTISVIYIIFIFNFIFIIIYFYFYYFMFFYFFS